jgi:hypothetical protein
MENESFISAERTISFALLGCQHLIPIVGRRIRLTLLWMRETMGVEFYFRGPETDGWMNGREGILAIAS